MPTAISVRFKFNPKTYWYSFPDPAPTKGDRVLVLRDGGMIFGWVDGDPFELTEEQSKLLKAPLQSIVRIADEEDLAKLEELDQKGIAAKEVFRELAEKCGLDIKPIDVEYLLGVDKAIFHFSSEERVDFRELVRELASRLHVHVDMKQIGVRDEARMTGGLGHCGGMLCCARMRGAFQPVSIRMAKEQDLPLNPSKVSGACGRLMCCLRYEFEAYKDFKSRAPKINASIETPAGEAKVVALDTLREKVQLKMEESGETFYVPLCGMLSGSDNEQQSRPSRVSDEAFECNCPQSMLREKIFEIADDELIEEESPTTSSRRRRKRGSKKNGEEKANQARRQPNWDADSESLATMHVSTVVGSAFVKAYKDKIGVDDEEVQSSRTRRHRNKKRKGNHKAAELQDQKSAQLKSSQDPSAEASKQGRQGDLAKKERQSKPVSRSSQNSDRARSSQDSDRGPQSSARGRSPQVSSHSTQNSSHGSRDSQRKQRQRPGQKSSNIQNPQDRASNPRNSRQSQQPDASRRSSGSGQRRRKSSSQSSQGSQSPQHLQNSQALQGDAANNSQTRRSHEAEQSRERAKGDSRQKRRPRRVSGGQRRNSKSGSDASSSRSQNHGSDKENA